MKDFFYAIQDLFVNVLFAPFDALRALELENWFGANTVSWIFIAIGFKVFFPISCFGFGLVQFYMAT